MTADIVALYASTAYADFPALQERLFFVDARDGKVRHPDPEIADLAQHYIDNFVFKDGDTLAITAEKYRGIKSSGCIGTASEKYVIHYGGEDVLQMLGKSATPEMQHNFILDHETGHALIPKGVKLNLIIEESVADCYAVLRHIQRYGSDEKVAGISLTRAFNLLMRDEGPQDIAHFTAPAVEKMLEIARDTPVALLTPQATFDLAFETACRHAMSDHRVAKLAESYAWLSASMENARNEAPVHQLARAALENKDEDAAKWGCFLLQAFLDGKASFSVAGKKIPLEGETWEHTRRQLLRKQASFRR